MRALLTMPAFLIISRLLTEALLSDVLIYLFIPRGKYNPLILSQIKIYPFNRGHISKTES